MRNHYLHSPISKATLMWLLFLLSSLVSLSQTTSIGGTVNSYHQVIEIVKPKAGIRVASTTGLSPLDKVMVIQMKGATINTTNAFGFGDVTAMNDAGKYEIGTICAIRSDTVFLVDTLLNSYTIANKVQLVRIRQYVNADVNSTLTATAWNNAAGTGGVIAIFVEQDLTLNAAINADSKGYAGGAPVLSNSSCNNSTNGYAYTASVSFPQSGSYKGEGIADVASNQTGGRGAPANGGGGGNNHNNAGGGGANLTAGGMGGGNSGTSTCNAAFKGEGGKALTSSSGQRIFLGGGGGAGHKNYSGSFSQGAEGGGIIFIHATNVIGNGFSISASGGYGGNSASDGGGGGGGGGTIIMDVANYTGAVSVSAQGGHGGDSEDGLNIKLCFGGGGGGSGGVIYFSGAAPAITYSVARGLAGVETNRDVQCDLVPEAAFDGTDGIVVPNYSFRKSIGLAPYCSQILPIRLNYFKASPAQKKVNLQWEASNPDDIFSFAIERMDNNYQWKTITNVMANSINQDYFAVDDEPLIGYNSYRIKITEKTNKTFYSVIRRVYFGDESQIFTVYPNPTTDRIVIKGNLNGIADIRLTDVSGKIVYRSKVQASNSLEIKLPLLPSGVYVLHINDGVEKLIIQ